MNYLAIYKGPATDLSHKIGHWGICFWTKSQYSHCEIVIDEWSYSASSRDKGVRRKQIDYMTGKWDLIPLPDLDVDYVLNFYEQTKNDKYDFMGLGWFVWKTIKHKSNRWFCSEWCATAMKIPGAEHLHIQDLANILNWMK